MQKEKSNKLLSVLIRYLILIITGIPYFGIFYFIFTPLTVYAVYYILGIFFEVVLLGNVILVNQLFPIEIIEACVAGAAYYLLLILNLSVPNVNFSKRIKMILLSFLSLFILNITRIVALSLIFIDEKPWFETVHIMFWYLGSIVLVVLIWFAEVAIFKIKSIPFYSDLKHLVSLFNSKRGK